MAYFLYSAVEREKRELTKWYDELMKSLTGELLVSNDDNFQYKYKCVKLDGREFQKKIEGFNVVKKHLLKLSSCEMPELKRIEINDDDDTRERNLSTFYEDGTLFEANENLKTETQ